MNRYAMGGYQPLEADGIEPSVGWEQFPTRTVGADRIRPQRKAPFAVLFAGATYSSPPTLGLRIHPGTSKNPGLRADNIRPYRGRVRSSSHSIDGQTPPPHVRSAPPLPGEARALRTAGGYEPPLRQGRQERSALRADAIRPYRGRVRSSNRANKYVITIIYI